MQAIVVERDPALLAYMTTSLQQNGWGVASCPSGPEGLACVRQQRPDLLVLDLHHSEFSDLDFITLLRYLIDPDDVRIIAVDGAKDELNAYARVTVIPVGDVTARFGSIVKEAMEGAIHATS